MHIVQVRCILLRTIGSPPPCIFIGLPLCMHVVCIRSYGNGANMAGCPRLQRKDHLRGRFSICGVGGRSLPGAQFVFCFFVAGCIFIFAKVGSSLCDPVPRSREASALVPLVAQPLRSPSFGLSDVWGRTATVTQFSGSEGHRLPAAVYAFNRVARRGHLVPFAISVQSIPPRVITRLAHSSMLKVPFNMHPPLL